MYSLTLTQASRRAAYGHNGSANKASSNNDIISTLLVCQVGTMVEIQDLTVGQVSGMIAAAVFLGKPPVVLHTQVDSDSLQLKFWSQ